MVTTETQCREKCYAQSSSLESEKCHPRKLFVKCVQFWSSEKVCRGRQISCVIGHSFNRVIFCVVQGKVYDWFVERVACFYTGE